MLNLIKLAVGAKTLEELERNVRMRADAQGLARVRTRSFPRRAEEILAGGSLYWVVAGWLRARHRVVRIEEAQDPDGSRVTAIMIDPAIVAVEGRIVRAFQGWRYLTTEAAPLDLRRGAAASAQDAMPDAMRRDLAELCLL